MMRDEKKKIMEKKNHNLEDFYIKNERNNKEKISTFFIHIIAKCFGR